MTNNNMADVAVEVSCILERFPANFIKKVPKDFIDLIKSIKSSTYIFIYDESKLLNEQNIKPETKGAIAYIYENFCCSNNEKEQYIKKCRAFNKQKEEEKRKMYNPDKIFKKIYSNIESTNIKTQKNNITSLVEYRKSFFTKLKNYIFRILQ